MSEDERVPVAIAQPDILSVLAHRPYALPGGHWRLAQRWNDLLFAHWPISAADLAPLLPATLIPDIFEGSAWAGVVPFWMDQVRTRAIGSRTLTVPGTAAFAELNLRTYVRSRVTGLPGVFFFSLDCASPLAVIGARTLFRLPYFWARMHRNASPDGAIEYNSQRLLTRQSVRFAATYRPLAGLAASEPGTLEHFLTERYSLFTSHGRVGHIHHLPWPLQSAEAEIRCNEIPAAHGITLPREPPILHFARSLDVYIWSLQRDRHTVRIISGMTDTIPRIALVTGASQGIGRACALALAAQGATVALAARSVTKLEEVATEIASSGGTAQVFPLDIADEDSIKACAKAVVAAFGTVSILVNNAGITRDILAMRMKRKDWDDVLSTNLTGAFLMAQAVMSPMVKARWGRIINITSVVGEMGQAGQANYAASKAGLIGLTKSLARELASRAITVNAVAPGYIETAMTAVLTDEQRTQMTQHIPLARPGTDQDVAQAVAFLASDAAAYITGHTLDVNGGMYMG